MTCYSTGQVASQHSVWQPCNSFSLIGEARREAETVKASFNRNEYNVCYMEGSLRRL
jgi:hypothetical protein